MRMELTSRESPPRSVFRNQPTPSNDASRASPAARYWLFAASVVAATYFPLNEYSSSKGLAGIRDTTAIKPTANAIRAYDSLTCLSEMYKARNRRMLNRFPINRKRSREINVPSVLLCKLRRMVSVDSAPGA